MTKAELLKLLETIEDGADINSTIGAVEEFKIGSRESIDYSNLTIDQFKELLANNQGINGYSQSLIDSAVSKGVETFKSSKMQKYIDDALKAKENEGKTPESAELQALKAEFESMKKEKESIELRNNIIAQLGQKGISNDWVDFIVADNLENSTGRLTQLETLLNTTVQAKAKEQLGGFQYDPKPPEGTDPNIVTVDKFKKMGYADRAKLYSENQELYTQLSSQTLGTNQ